MALRDESERELQKLIADSGLMKELLTLDGVMNIADRMASIKGNNTALSWWVLVKKKGDTTTWFFGSD